MPGRRRAGYDTGLNQVIDRVFVYGTLRSGEPARSLIANHEASAATATAWGRIYAFPDGYPGLVEATDGAGAQVVGEVIYLSELPAALPLLDAYEGSDFVRVIRAARLENGDTTWAWIYLLADPALAERATPIPDGDWVRFRSSGRAPTG